MRVGFNEVGIETHGRDGRSVVEAARAIEAAGFHSVWVPERIVSRAQGDDEHPYGADRDVTAIRKNGFFDAAVSMGAIAVATERVRIGTYVSLAALRHPFITAQQLATVDQLSGGRVTFGVGAGWYEDEFVLLGSDFSDRGSRLTEYLQVVRALWTTPVTTFHGRHLDFENAVVGPKPVQRPHPPIVIGGNSAATIARIVAVGDGWVGYGLTVENARSFIERLGEALADAGRQLEDVSLTIGYRLPGVGLDMSRDEVDPGCWAAAGEYVAACAEAGLDEVVFTARFPPDGYAETLDGFAQAIDLERYRGE